MQNLYRIRLERLAKSIEKINRRLNTIEDRIDYYHERKKERKKQVKKERKKEPTQEEVNQVVYEYLSKYGSDPFYS